MHQPPRYTISPENLIFVVILEDPPTHTIEHPFCADDPECPCRSDSDLVREFIDKPLDNGLLTNSEAIRLYFGTQLVPTQDELITDELTDDEPNIVDRRNVWNGYEQAMAWEAAEEEWRRATDSCDFEPDDEPTSDEEIEQVMSEPSPLEVDIEENYHRSLRISAQFQQQMDSLLLEHD